MNDLLSKILPYLETVRGWLEVPSNFIANALALDPERASWIVFGLLSFFIGKKVFNFFYTDTDGRTIYLIILVAVLFYILKFLGVSP